MTALVHLKADDYAYIRHMRIRSLSSKRSQEALGPEMNIDPGIVAILMLYQYKTMQQIAWPEFVPITCVLVEFIRSKADGGLP